MNLVEFKGTGAMEGGIVSINPQYIASVYTDPNGYTAIVMANGIGYQVAGSRQEVLQAISPTKH